MKKVHILTGLVMISVVLLLGGCKKYDIPEFGEEYANHYANELEMALGEYEIGFKMTQTVPSGLFNVPDMLITTWRITFKDSEGVEQTFHLDNSLPIESNIYSVSEQIIIQRVYAYFDGLVTEDIKLIGFDSIYYLPVEATFESLFPKNIRLSNLPENILIQVMPSSTTDLESLVNRAIQQDEVSFFIMTSPNEGVIIKKGVKLEKIYTQQEAFSFPNLN